MATAEKKVKKGFMDGYKTYDTSNGFGSPEKWRNAFEQRMNFKVLTVKEKEDNNNFAQSLYDAKNQKELQKAYHKLMMIHHPDKNNNSEESKIISQHLNDVYFELKEKLD